MDLSAAFANKKYQSIVDYFSSLTSSGAADPHERVCRNLLLLPRGLKLPYLCISTLF